MCNWDCSDYSPSTTKATLFRKELTMYYKRLLKIITGVILLFTGIISIQAKEVYAGSINSEESRLLEYVNQTFEQDDVSYKVNSSYITKLKNKLMQEDIDLTADDVELIIGEINNNVTTGVDNGYLVRIEESEESKHENSIESEQPFNEQEANKENTGIDESNGSDHTEINSETNSQENSTTGINGTQDTTSVPTKESDSHDDIKDSETGEDITIPLKNTGYSIGKISYYANCFLILMLFGLLSIYVLNYIEVSNETKK